MTPPARLSAAGRRVACTRRRVFSAKTGFQFNYVVLPQTHIGPLLLGEERTDTVLGWTFERGRLLPCVRDAVVVAPRTQTARTR